MPEATDTMYTRYMNKVSNKLGDPEGLHAAAELNRVGQNVLDRYRSSHTKEEIDVDTSIIGHLIRYLSYLMIQLFRFYYCYNYRPTFS